MDVLEKVYLAGFPFLLLFVTLFPIWASRRRQDNGEPDAGYSKLEFLPLMATSVYCSIGLIWGFCRLIFIYHYEETTYQGQLNEIR
jgi:alpha-1,3-glucosyltransferase